MPASGGRPLDLDCGISYARIVGWLDDELGLCRAGDSWTFAVGESACRIKVEPLDSRVLGVIALERAHLIADGDAEAIAAFEQLFTLRFISAGG